MAILRPGDYDKKENQQYKTEIAKAVSGSKVL